MRTSFSANIALLASVTLAMAWSITAYNNVDGYSANGETEYLIIEGDQGNCYTFGWSMPDTTCGHYLCPRWGREPRMLWHAYEDFQDTTTQRANDCMNTREILAWNLDVDSWEYIASFKCVGLEAL
ncbi:hypothetical protein NM208_g12786 [Fusarium decemcellulare]|uniref:Uncharacterized protein n=1 Tax=Fusarium decemcellulare TaxID=57161 RepID=A0ACC1RRN4_9HYPO|nr:hypothetical protein NM208_g12786 [Fusarium decemcellulare]